MRIEAYNQVQQLYNTRKPGQVKKSAGASFSDQVQISRFGKDIQTPRPQLLIALMSGKT